MEEEKMQYQYPSRHLRGNPFKNIDSFWDDYFNFPQKYSDTSVGLQFEADVYERENEYYIEAEFAGIPREQISVEADRGKITVTAKRSLDRDVDNDNFIIRERCFGNYERSFVLRNLDEKNIHAEYKDGLLKITAKKTTHTSNGNNKITIH